MCRLIVFCVLLVTVGCYAQLTQVNEMLNNSLHIGLSEHIGNFSNELLYYTTQTQPKPTNLVISPISIWTILAVIAEGATEDTQRQIYKSLHIKPNLIHRIRREYQEIAKWLQVKTQTVELQKLNALFINELHSPLKYFLDAAGEYDVSLITENFSDPEMTVKSINLLISNVTHGRIPELVNYDDIVNSNLILTSTIYFKGQWSVPFKSSFTTKSPFYDSTGKKLGEVNMMYRRHNYPFAILKSLQTRILEIPYGTDNRLSMLIMLPNPGVSINDMFYNFRNVSLDIILHEFKVLVEEFGGDDEIDCFIPRFKIKSSLELSNPLKDMGIIDLFDKHKAQLPLVSYRPVHVSKIIHKAEIEVTEEAVASAVTLAEFANRMDAAFKFIANRPFYYLIIEKVTNSIVFSGFYHSPSLF